MNKFYSIHYDTVGEYTFFRTKKKLLEVLKNEYGINLESKHRRLLIAGKHVIIEDEDKPMFEPPCQLVIKVEEFEE